MDVKEYNKRTAAIKTGAKKDFTKKDAKSVDVVGDITKEKSASSDKLSKNAPRFTARFDELEWAYLSEKHWQERRSITDIIRELVQEDMKKHPEILAGIDELNEK